MSSEMQAANALLNPLQTKGGGSRLIWVVASNRITTKSASWDWFESEHDATEAFEQKKNLPSLEPLQHHLFTFEIEGDSARMQINADISNFYHEHSITKEFNKLDDVKGFPFTPDGWIQVVALHTELRPE